MTASGVIRRLQAGLLQADNLAVPKADAAARRAVLAVLPGQA